MSLLKVNEVQNYNGSSLTLTASTVSTSAQLNTGGNISVTGSINVSDDSTTRSNLGLGTMATQNANAVAITGGTINTVQPASGQSLTIKDEDGNTAITVGTDNTAASYLSLNFGSYHGGSGGAGSGTLSGNTLSDYEEGTFDITLSSGTFTTTETANYTKIGRVVFVAHAFINVNTSGASGDASITGLPFTNKNETRARTVGSVWSNALEVSSSPVTDSLASTINYNSSSVTIAVNDSLSSVDLEDRSAAYLYFSITYIVD